MAATVGRGATDGIGVRTIMLHRIREQSGWRHVKTMLVSVADCWNTITGSLKTTIHGSKMWINGFGKHILSNGLLGVKQGCLHGHTSGQPLLQVQRRILGTSSRLRHLGLTLSNFQ